MSVELQLLVWATALTLVQAIIAAIGAQLQVGLPALAGNRERLPHDRGLGGSGPVGRTAICWRTWCCSPPLCWWRRSPARSNVTTALGAQLFFWARLVYVPVYLIGIPWVRTGVWAVSVVGLVLIFQQLV